MRDRIIIAPTRYTYGIAIAVNRSGISVWTFERSDHAAREGIALNFKLCAIALWDFRDWPAFDYSRHLRLYQWPRARKAG